MTKFIALVRINLLDLLLSTFGSKSSSRRKKRQTSGWVVLLGLAGLMLYVSGVYSYLLAETLAPLGNLESLLSLMLLFAVLFCTTLTLYLAQSLLFSAKDNGQLFSFPISAFSILLARLSALYLEVLFIMEVFLLPTGIVYLIFSDTFHPLFLPFLLLEGIFLSFIPTLISLLFGLLNSFIIAKTPFKTLFTVLIGLLVPLCIMVVSFTFSSSTVSASSIISMSNTLNEAFLPISWAVTACVEGNILFLLLIAGLCLLPFFLFTLLISRFYKPLITGLLNTQNRSDFKLQNMQHQSPFKSLFFKEAKRFFGTPNYFLNASFGLIILLLTAFSSLFFQNEVDSFLAPSLEILQESDFSDTSVLLGIFLLGLLSFINLTFQPSAVSLSLEGNTLWILKSSPLPCKTIFLAKAAFPFACASLSFLVATPLLAFALSLSPLQALGIFLLMLPSCALTSLLGLVFNLKHPRLDSANEIVVIKQSLSTFLGVLFGLLQAFVVLTLYTIFAVLGFGAASFLPVFLLLLCACILSYLWLQKRGAHLFAALGSA